MTSEIPPLSREMAEQCLAAITEQYRWAIDGWTDDDGTQHRGIDPPALFENYADTGHWAIAWEDGPDQWALRAFQGGFDEELYHLAYPETLAAAQRAGLAGDDAEQQAREQARALATKQAHPCPKGVLPEPYYSFVLCLYPDS